MSVPASRHWAHLTGLLVALEALAAQLERDSSSQVYFSVPYFWHGLAFSAYVQQLRSSSAHFAGGPARVYAEVHAEKSCLGSIGRCGWGLSTCQ